MPSLNPAFEYVFDAFKGIESQMLLQATVSFMDAQFRDSYLKWDIPGMGEAYGYFIRLKESKKVFVLYTLVHFDRENDSPIEWILDAHDLATAEEVCQAMKIPAADITWRQGDT